MKGKITLLITLFLSSTLANKQDTSENDIERGLTTHFSSWLKANGYEKYGFERTDL